MGTEMESVENVNAKTIVLSSSKNDEEQANTLIGEALENNSTKLILDGLTLGSIPRTILGLKNQLESLSVRHCNLNNLPDLSSFPNLKELQLRGNNISSFEYFLPSVTTLDISDNKLNTLDKATMPHLRNLDCSHNQMNSVPYFEELVDLNVTNNKPRVLIPYGLDNLKKLKCDHTVVLPQNLNEGVVIEKIFQHDSTNLISIMKEKQLEIFMKRIITEIESLGSGDNFSSIIQAPPIKAPHGIIQPNGGFIDEVHDRLNETYGSSAHITKTEEIMDERVKLVIFLLTF